MGKLTLSEVAEKTGPAFGRFEESALNILCTPNPLFHPLRYIACRHCFKNFDGPRRRTRRRAHEKYSHCRGIRREGNATFYHTPRRAGKNTLFNRYAMRVNG